MSLSIKYDSSPPITKWALDNRPDEDLICKKGMNYQVDDFVKLAEELGLEEPGVASTHTSKSIHLPVPMFKVPNGFVFVRNNFHDIKMTVMVDLSLELNYDDIYSPYSKKEYEEDKKSSIWSGAAKDPKKAKRQYDDKRADYDSDDWYHKHWSSGPLVREGDKTWTVGGIHKVYCEGINCIGLPIEAFRSYEKKGKNSMMFTLEVYHYDKLKEFVARVIQSAARHTDPDGIMRRASATIADLAVKEKIIYECRKQLDEIWKSPEDASDSREVLQTKVESIVAMYRLGRYNKTDGQAAMDIVLSRDDYNYKPNTPLYKQDFSIHRFISELRRFTNIAWREVI